MTQYSDKKAIEIANLVETTWLVRYPRQLEITYDQGGELLGHEFKNILIENEYGIKNNPDSPGNPQENTTIERIHQVLGNLVLKYNIQEMYVYDADPFMGILAAAYFAIRSMYHRTKVKIPVQLVFGRDMILPINHVADRRYIRQRKQTQINKYLDRENTTRIDYDYRAGDKVLTKMRSAYKYKTLFRGPYEIVWTWKNGTSNLLIGTVTHIINIRNIKPYNDADVE